MSARLSRAIPPAFRRLYALSLGLAMAWRRRRLVGELGALDEHLLADIGITRQDVLSVLAEPLYADPSHLLAERARETRYARRAQRREARRLSEADLAPLVPVLADDRRAA